jgi:hypothetical protein
MTDLDILDLIEKIETIRSEPGDAKDYEEYTDGWIDACNSVLDLLHSALAQPAPQGPTDEDLYDLADVFNGDPVPAIRRALELWGSPAIEPVPVAERLPGPEDCLGRPWEGTDAGFCWWFYPGLDGWRLMVATRWEGGIYQNWTPIGTTHWLPHYVLPIPQQENI